MTRLLSPQSIADGKRFTPYASIMWETNEFLSRQHNTHIFNWIKGEASVSTRRGNLHSMVISENYAVLGSLERFFGVLVEHYAGDFPLWLSPIQARLLPVTDTQLGFCNEVLKKLKDNGIRAEVCYGERLPKLIGNAEKQKIPLMAVVGPKELETGTVTVRSRFSGELGTMTVDELLSKAKSAIEKKFIAGIAYKQ